jgi:hypothetical protein
VRRKAEVDSGRPPRKRIRGNGVSEGVGRLNSVYAGAGLPLTGTPDHWPMGERRVLEEAGVMEFAREVHRPRKQSRAKAEPQHKATKAR